MALSLSLLSGQSSTAIHIAAAEPRVHRCDSELIVSFGFQVACRSSLKTPRAQRTQSHSP